MSFWDNVKKFAQPYADDDYDDYDEDDDYAEDYEEPAEAPAPRREKRRAAPAPVMDEEEDDFGFAPVPAAAPSSAPATGFSGQILNMSSSNKQEVVLFRPGSFNPKPSSDSSELRLLINFFSIIKSSF